MVTGDIIVQRDLIQKPELNYRKLDALNCSMIRLFDENPVKFFEIFKQGKSKKDEKGVSLIIGDIVDFYLLDCKGDENEFTNRFDEKFALADGKIGMAQVFTLANILFDISCEAMDPVTKEIKTSFSSRFTEAANRAQAKGLYKGKKEDKILEDFDEKGRDYFQTLMDNIGKTVIDVSLLEKSKRVAEILLNDSYTQEIFQDRDDQIEYFPKFPIEWVYTTKNHKSIKCKSEVDILQLDHHKKIIFVRDLKTTYDNEGFEYSYIKHSYYLQAAFYHLAVKYWAAQEGLSHYTIMPMEFIVGDTSANNRRPIRYQITHEDLQAGMHGFKFRGVSYRGIHDLIEEISWAEDSSNWNVSKNVYDNYGKLRLNIEYDR